MIMTFFKSLAVPVVMGAVLMGTLTSAVAADTKRGLCPSRGFRVCDTTFRLPYMQEGDVQTLVLPSKYGNHRTYHVQCLQTTTGYVTHQLIEEGMVDCTVVTCPASSVSLCGLSVEIPGGAELDTRRRVPLASTYLPADLVTRASADVACVDPDQPHYDDLKLDQLSCNDFLCQPRRFKLCDKEISVDKGAALGESLEIQVPGTTAAVTVRCLGSLGNAPTYEIVTNPFTACFPQILP